MIILRLQIKNHNILLFTINRNTFETSGTFFSELRSISQRHNMLASSCLSSCHSCPRKMGLGIWYAFNSCCGQCDSAIWSIPTHKPSIWLSQPFGISCCLFLLYFDFFQQTLLWHAFTRCKSTEWFHCCILMYDLVSYLLKHFWRILWLV